MRIKLSECADLQGVATSVYTEATEYIENGEHVAARAMISGLCAGFALGKYGSSQMHEEVEALICDLIVDAVNLHDLLEVIREG